MAGSAIPKLRLVLTPNSSYGRIVVGLESFLEFSHEIRNGLAQLEDRWEPFAAPRAQGHSLEDRSRAAVPRH